MRRKPKFFRAPDTGAGAGTDNGTNQDQNQNQNQKQDQSERIRQLEDQVKQLQSDLAKATVNNRNQKKDPEKTPDEIVMDGLSEWASHNYDPAKLAEGEE